MIITITDIPAEGRSLEFDLDTASLNQRVNAVLDSAEEGTVAPPEYRFITPPRVELQLSLQGSTVLINGKVSGSFAAACSRCAEDLETSLCSSVSLALKPRRGEPGTADEAEDIDFGYYIGQEINCADLVEEQLILQLPQTVTCSAPSIEECPRASARIKDCMRQAEQKEGDERLALFRTLKIN